MMEHTRQKIANIATVLMRQSPPSAACTESGNGLPFIQGNAEFGSRFPEPRQMTAVSSDGLDDMNHVTADSTSVWSNSQWPTDSELINKIVGRAFRTGQKLYLCGLPNFREWQLPTWLKKLDRLSF